MPPKKKVERILNVIPSPKQEDDWQFEHAVAAGMTRAAPTIPDAKDLRADWWQIGDQGGTGSCVGWALADSVLRWHFANSGELQHDQILSPRFIWMASKETDEFVTQPTTFIEREGTSLKSALDIARNYGSVPDSTLPFGSAQLYQGDLKTFYALAARLKIASYFNLGINPGNWRTWIATNGPILVRMDVDATWDNAKGTGGNLDTYQPDTKRGGHAVALVGYTVDMPDTKRGGHAVALVGYTVDRFIVRNSWGTSQWGDKGFGYASMSYAQQAFTEAYGVTV